jgi:hypothetical protein
MKETAYPSLVAQQLNVEYVNRAKPTNSNHKIARMILSYEDYQSNDFVLTEWTSTIRNEFRTEQGWMGTSRATYKQGTGLFEEHYYKQGPGQWEYTGVYSKLKEIVLAQTFLKSKNINYLFTFYTNEILHSTLYLEPDEFIGPLIDLIDWTRFLHFDDQGFLPWCQSNNLEFEDDGSHPAPSAHQLGADYILKNFKLG